MNVSGRSNGNRQVKYVEGGKLLPIAQAIALIVATSGVMGSAHAARPFSLAWYTDRGLLQQTARTTGMVNGRPVSSLSPQAQQQKANTQLQQSIANLSLAAHGIAFQQAQQAAIRQAQMGNPSSILDGLGVGGLDAGSLAASWTNANAPTQTTDANGNVVVDIKQTADKAIANWNTFNVGKNTIVQFDQASADWAILNRVADPLGKPSEIRGQIRAPGTVLIVNKNGIVFTGTSQINTRNLVAAAAEITDTQFTTGGIYGANQSASFTNAQGNLIVDQGAQITTSTPTSATQGGGYVLLMGQQVSNSGNIQTPRGQIELAAGDSFIIRKGVGTDANQPSTTRGNEISPQFIAGSTAGQVVNTELGLLLAREGDVTLAGRDVQQNGVAVATTSVNTRGTIHLLNSASDTTGLVTLGGKAITTIVLDDDGTTALDSQRDALIKDSADEDAKRGGTSIGVFDNLSKQTDREDQGRIEIVSGGDVRFATGSLTLATGGQIAVSAANRTFAADGSILDVSGAVGVNLAMASNNVVVNVQGNELRDSPDNRDSGSLFNSNITIDRRSLIEVKAIPGVDDNDRWYTANGLLEVSGYLNNQQHGIGEWAAQGGTIQLGGKEVVAQTGSQINLSGGTLNVATGYVAQTWLVGSDGNLYNANNAPANMTFRGVYKGFEVSHPRWGADASQFFYNPLIAPQQRLENGYTVGRDAGQLIVDAPTAVLEGDIVATVYNGPQQVRGRDAVDGYNQAQTAAAKAGVISFGQYGPGGLLGLDGTDIQVGNIADITAGVAADAALSSDRSNTLWLDAGRLNAEGLGGLNLASSDSISIDAPLQLTPGGQLSLLAPMVDIAADITAASGSVSATNVFQNTQVTTPGGVKITLESGATIDTRGLWVNGVTDPDGINGLAWLNGGNVSLDSTADLTLAAGSVIDVSSGGAVLAGGKTRGGRGGNVTLIAGHAVTGVTNAAGTLTIDGDIRAAGVNGGGTLTISSPGNVLIGDNAVLSGGMLAAGAAAPVTLLLAQPLTIAAGQALPMALDQIFTSLQPGVPAPFTLPLDETVLQSLYVGADWTVPPGVVAFVGNTAYANFSNPTVPAHSIITTLRGQLPTGTVIDPTIFANGLPTKPYTITLAAGSIQSTAMTYQIGTSIAPGVVLPQNVSVLPAPAFKPSFFNAGFSAYDINGGNGLLVADGTVVTPTMPVYRIDADSFAVRSDSDPSTAMSLWLPPLFSENPQNDTLTQRGGASLTLRSQSTSDGVRSGQSVVIGSNAAVTVDAGQSIKLEAFRQITVDGQLTAHGGSITLVNDANGSVEQAHNFDLLGNGRGFSLWLGEGALLDVSGTSYSALDARGRRYGVAADGGAISLNGANTFVVVRPGAQLDADGASTVIDPAGAAGSLLLASKGGSISLASTVGLYLNGNMHAVAGGAGAAGGSLSIALNNPAYPDQAGITVPASVLVPGVMTVVQSAPASLLPDGVTPDKAAALLQFGQATVSADAIKAGGFGSLALNADDYMMFAGDVSLPLNQSLTLTAGAFISGPVVSSRPSPTSTPATGHVSLSAPYLLLSGSQNTVPDSASTPSIRHPTTSGSPTAAIFEANADQIDVRGSVAFSANTNGKFAPGYQTVSLTSQGDIRFLPDGNLQQVGTTTLSTDWDLNLTAAQIYPATGVIAKVSAGLNNPTNTATLTIGRVGDVDPAMPLSAFGALTFSAAFIEQGGVVRAPLGSIVFGTNSPSDAVHTQQVDLLPGSITSVSAAGLNIPYGGTVDGVTYSYNGATVTPVAFDINNNGVVSGIQLNAQAIDVKSGAVLDLSGGGDLTGAGFVSGRGGSVNILNTPLINANPATPMSNAGDKVYAIVPGYASGYAPVTAEKGGGDPAIGQQVTIGAGVPGLPAGVYTLLPSTYALLPGAYRVEIGKTVANAGNVAGGATAIGNGTYATSGNLGVANTDIKNALASTLLITPGSALRRYSQFNEQSYSDFMSANAALFGAVRPVLPSDGKSLMLSFAPSSGTMTRPALSFDGTALLQGAAGGFGGQAVVGPIWGGGNSSAIDMEVYGDAPTAGFNGISIAARDLNAIAAPRLLIGGYDTLQQPNSVVSFVSNGNLSIGDGVTLRAAELFLLGSNVKVGDNVALSTIGQGAAPFDSTDGYSYSAGTGTVLALSNGDLNFIGSNNTSGSLTVGAGASLYAEGTLAFATKGMSSIDPSASFGARNIALAASGIDIGSAADIAAAGAAGGLQFNQALFDTLLHGDPSRGAPMLERITLAAGGAISLYGNTSLDATGSGVDLVLNTPAIYGHGAAGDEATIAAGKITWNGVVGATPPAIAGTGLGTLNLKAGEIDLGQFVSLDTTAVSRVIYGFNDVNLIASDKITAAGNSSLYVYQAPSAAAGAVFGQSGTGGNLTLTTPLLTGVQKSIVNYTAGGVLSVAAPDGVAPSAANSSVAGAEIDLNGDSVIIGSTILLPSGKLAVTATNDITLQDGSHIDLSGQTSMIQTAAVYGFGGIVSFESAQGNVIQSAGSTIDVSATKANAGSITATAAGGRVGLSGSLQGAADQGYASADFSATAATIDDFDGLNTRLTQGGVFDARSFDVKSGSLTVGDGVKAHAVTIAADNGDLTVTGRIDASGAAPGTIRLSAQGDLTITGGAVLDAHGDTLQVDSYGQVIAAKNRGHIELNTAAGTLQLQPGATMDLSTPDGGAYGEVQLNAPRTGETSGDIAINAGGPLNIRGAYGVALNAMWTYDLAGGSVIDQTLLDGYDRKNQDFITAAYNGNTDAGVLTSNLQNKLGGLLALGNSFHLRPGVQITSSGDLSTSGDIDLSKYRYGPNADRDLTSANYGAGEPMALAVRAAGNLTIKGSISDGFGPGLAGSPPIYGDLVDITTNIWFSFFPADESALGDGIASYFNTSDTQYFTAAWTMPNDTFYNDAIGIGIGLFVDVNGTAYLPGSVIPAGTAFAPNTAIFEAGPTLPTVLATSVVRPGTPDAPPTSPLSVMLPAGSMSASLRLVAGADLGAADPRALQTVQGLRGSGNLTFNDPNYNPSLSNSYLSVVRTGTGSLDLLAGGNFSEATPYGIYTAGTQSAPILAADGSNPYDLVGKTSNTHAWYPEQGGDVLISAQGDVSGNIQLYNNNVQRYVDANLVSNWLWLQGGAGLTADPGAWSINFGTLGRTDPSPFDSPDQSFIGFQGIGTLGGGNLTVIAGRNAGTLQTGQSTGLNLAVGSTGRVLADGTLVQTGGGDLVLKVGGTLNAFPASVAQNMVSDYFGSITDLRGNVRIDAGAIGQLAQNVGADYGHTYDPRVLDAATFKRSMQTPGPAVLPGDGSVQISARGDLVMGGAGDAGMVALAKADGLPYTSPDGTVNAVGGDTHFTLWRRSTAISLYSAGGDVGLRAGSSETGVGASEQNANGYYPGTLSVAAANGSIRFPEQVDAGTVLPLLELIPAPQGQLELLAADSIYGSGRAVALSGADRDSLATPLQPLFRDVQTQQSNATKDAASLIDRHTPIAFGEDTPQANLHAGDTQPARIYAGVDIDDLQIGAIQTPNPDPFGTGFNPEHATWYIAAKPFEVIAGRDIVGNGATPDVFVNNTPADISFMHAGRDIIYQSATVAGPGVLELQARRNLYQGYYGMLDSAGLLYNVNSANRSGGADIVAVAGVGANGPDYADFAKLYFDAANQLPDGTVLAGSGKVTHAYDQELLAWLQQRFGYSGTSSDALAYFLALPSAQQGVFARQVYYAELTAGGREFNDASSARFQSYLRGREAIATLFPTQNAKGNAISYDGALTMFSSVTGTDFIGGVHVPHISDAGIQTKFGGDIQILNPGGQTLIGVEGVSPGAGAGLITQGEGDIDVYSAGSILLGQSRIMTTFGGNILAWSATGDINAGRGSKTTVLFTPPRRVYDDLGDVTLSPDVPSTGAGIATLNPIPEVAAGDVDLIAPLGTIDAGEAGIRVSGNVNLAALQVVNAANIQVQGKSTGLPLVATVNVGALINASAAASSAAMAAQDVMTRDRAAARQNLPSIFTVRVLGFGNEPAEGNDKTPSAPSSTQSSVTPTYDPSHLVQLVGLGGSLDPQQMKRLTDDERRRLQRGR